MTLLIHSRFQTAEKCVHLKVFLHVGAWRGRALFPFAYHCDVIARAERRTLRGRRRWLEAGDTDLTADNSASKITQFDCYNLNDRDKMEIDHYFAPGATVGRATTRSCGRPWWLYSYLYTYDLHVYANTCVHIVICLYILYIYIYCTCIIPCV